MVKGSEMTVGFLCYSWFMGALSRKESERLLLTPGNETGCFLIRESETSPGLFFS